MDADATLCNMRKLHAASSTPAAEPAVAQDGTMHDTSDDAGNGNKRKIGHASAPAMIIEPAPNSPSLDELPADEPVHHDDDGDDDDEHFDDDDEVLLDDEEQDVEDDEEYEEDEEEFLQEQVDQDQGEAIDHEESSARTLVRISTALARRQRTRARRGGPTVQRVAAEASLLRIASRMLRDTLRAQRSRRIELLTKNAQLVEAVRQATSSQPGMAAPTAAAAAARASLS